MTEEQWPNPPLPPNGPELALKELLSVGAVWGDSSQWLRALPPHSVDLFFTSPPYADARSYSRIHPDLYVEWFLPFAEAMLEAAKETGSFVLNIKNRVAKSGPLRGQRHPFVYKLVLALQDMGWRWLETYIWAKPNAVPGRFGPRTKDSFEYVYHFAKGRTPYWDLDSIRVPYRTSQEEIERRKRDTNGRKNTEAGFGRDRTKTYRHGGADPGNVISVAQSYNQHYGPAGKHTAAMPEGLVEFFAKAACPVDGIILDPFLGSGTTVVVARRHDRQAGGIELHEGYANVARQRIEADEAFDPSGELSVAD